MIKNKTSLLFEQKNIIPVEELKFNSAKEEIDILNKFEILHNNKINLNYVNNDLIKIISQTDLSEEILKKLRKINWEDFKEIFSKRETKRDEKIYEQFLKFIKTELGILEKEEPLTKTLTLTSKDMKNAESIAQDLFSKKDIFDETLDSRNKAREFGVEILFDYNEVPNKITVNDFILYFNRRLAYFTELLSNRVDQLTLTSISKLKDLFETNETVSVIGLINEITKTKNGHTIITIEDKGGQIKCFINKDKLNLLRQIEILCLDEGVAIVGKIGKDIIWTDEIIIPSPPNSIELKETKNEEYVIFLSDIHFGAKVFVDEAFTKLIDWLNSRTTSDELNNIAKKIKYLIIAGDLIEGIGIYPNQGKDARILSTEMQYHETARWLTQIPKHIKIICIPGNHDTDRLSEPQLKLPYDKAYALYNMDNLMMLSNPSIIKLFGEDASGGLTFMIYHGGSIFYYADKIQFLREKGGAKTPEEVVKYLLEKRHLAPSHGSTLYIPDSQQDPLVIKNMPDFFITGHTHKLSVSNYKGCTIVSCGCWVEMSDYQEKLGMFPDIGKCTLVNTKTRKVKIINFYTEKHKREDKK